MTDLELQAIENEQLKQIEKSSIAIFSMENPSEKVKYAAIKKFPGCVGKLEHTPEMVAYAIRCGSAAAFKLDMSKTTEKDIIEGIKNSEMNLWWNEFCQALPEELMSKKIATAAVKKYSMCIGYPAIKPLKDDKLIELAFKSYEREYNWFKENDSDHKCSMQMVLTDEELTDDRVMKILEIEGDRVLWRFGKSKNKLSKKVREYIVKTYKKSLEELSLDGEEILLWYDSHFNEDMRRSYIWDRLFSEYNDKTALLEKHGHLIVNIKKPKAGEKMAAIKCDPMNLQHIYQQTEKLCMAALEINKDAFKFVNNKTKKILKFMGIEEEKKDDTEKSKQAVGNEFKDNANYLVTMEINLADEGYLHYSSVVKGKNMDKFLNQYVSVSFGNLDGEDELVRLVANYQEITDDEIKTIKKLGLLGRDSGVWKFNNN